METKTSINGHSSSNLLLTGAIFLANLDFAGLADYAIKAAIGGAIWLGYKVTADYIDKRRRAASPDLPQDERDRLSKGGENKEGEPKDKNI